MTPLDLPAIWARKLSPVERHRALGYEEEMPEELAWKLVQTEVELAACLDVIEALCEAAEPMAWISGTLLAQMPVEVAHELVGMKARLQAALARVKR